VEDDRRAEFSDADLDAQWLEGDDAARPEPIKLADDEERIGRLTLVHADRVAMKPLSPLWPGRIYIGKLTTVAGVPDQGKSMVTCDIAARVSRGLAWPDGSGVAPRGTVVFLAAEDDKADTIVPRLAAAGADLSKVKILNSLVISHKDKKQRRTFNIAEDLAELTLLVRRYPDTRVLFVDPTNAFMGTSKENDSFRDSDVRAVLGPLKEWAEEHGVAVVLITHFKKGGTGRALDQVMGSLAFVALARSSWAFLEEKDEAGEPTGRKLLAKIKQNITAPVDALACHIEGVELSNGLSSAKIVWEEAVEGNADMIMSGAGSQKLSIAKAFLLGTLAEGPVAASEVLADAKRSGIAEKTLNRAKKELGIVSTKLAGAWHWEVGETEMPQM
jgi:putative DNA primase/helicase